MIPILKGLGISIDSSGVKGSIMRSKKNTYDYRRLVDRLGYWWTADDSILQKGPKGKNIMEMPIFSRPYLPLDPRKPIIHYRGTKLSARHISGSAASATDLWAVYYSMISDIRWDFCKMDAGTMWSFYRAGAARDDPNDIKTMVMIGHTKEYDNHANFDTFLKKATGKGVRFTTFGDVKDSIG
jgi:hypothetical protein